MQQIQHHSLTLKQVTLFKQRIMRHTCIMLKKPDQLIVNVLMKLMQIKEPMLVQHFFVLWAGSIKYYKPKLNKIYYSNLDMLKNQKQPEDAQANKNQELKIQIRQAQIATDYYRIQIQYYQKQNSQIQVSEQRLISFIGKRYKNLEFHYQEQQQGKIQMLKSEIASPIKLPAEKKKKETKSKSIENHLKKDRSVSQKSKKSRVYFEIEHNIKPSKKNQKKQLANYYGRK